MRKTLAPLLLALFGFGPCSKSEAPAEPEKPKSPENEKPADKKKEAKDDDEFVPEPVAGNWVGETEGTTKEGGKWRIQVWNCSGKFDGPWNGYFTFTLNTQGMSMKGQSVDWPATTFSLKKLDAPKEIAVKSKVTATGPAKLDVTVDTKLEVSLEPTKYFLIREKTQTAAGTASAGPASMPLFGSAEGNKMHKIALTANACVDGHPLKMLK